MRLTKLVYRPRMALRAKGCSVICSWVKIVGAVGKSKTSIASQSGKASCFKDSKARIPLKVSMPVMDFAGARISRSSGIKACESVGINRPMAWARSANHGPWYNNSAARKNGEMSISTSTPPRTRKVSRDFSKSSV